MKYRKATQPIAILEQVLNASSRAAEMVKQILTFSRQGQIERKPLDIIPIVKEV